jgi:hypothetical protein
VAEDQSKKIEELTARIAELESAVREVARPYSESVGHLFLFQDTVQKYFRLMDLYRLGQSVGAFYKSLQAAGMTNQEAFELTKEYLSTLSLDGLPEDNRRVPGGGEGMVREKIRHETEEGGK